MMDVGQSSTRTALSIQKIVAHDLFFFQMNRLMSTPRLE